MDTCFPADFETLLAGLVDLPPQQARVDAFVAVRDLAYGDIGSRNPFDVLKAKKGTCSGKHALLKLLLERLGYGVQSYFAKHDFSRFPIEPWPEELRQFRNKLLTDYHDFLKVNVEGRWMTVDAVFDQSMKPLGFPVYDWDGLSEMILPVKAQQVFACDADVEEHKKALIAELPLQVQRDRKAFLEALTKWLDGKR